MKQIDRKLLFHLVDIVWGDAFEDESVPSTAHARTLIIKAIERRRGEKYSKQKLNIASVVRPALDSSEGGELLATARKTHGECADCFDWKECFDFGCQKPLIRK